MSLNIATTKLQRRITAVGCLAVIAVGCAHPPPEPAGLVGPEYAPAPPSLVALACQVGVTDQGDVVVGEKKLNLTLEPSRKDATPELASWPWTDNSVLIAVRPEWSGVGWPKLDGRLWEVECTPTPTLKPFFEKQGADFGNGALSPDGSTLYVGTTDGIVALDLSDKTERRLTRTPPIRATACDTSEATHERDVVIGLSPDGTVLHFVRGAPCGFRGDWSATPWALMFPEDAAQIRVRKPWSVSSVAADTAGVLWLADGGRCDAPGIYDNQTVGALWRSLDQGTTWQRVEVNVGYGPNAQMLTAPHAVLADVRRPGHLVVLSQLCSSSAWTLGGSLYLTRDGGVSWEVLALNEVPRPKGVRFGHGVEAVTLVDGNIDALLLWIDAHTLKIADGKATMLQEQPAPEAPSTVELEGATFTATEDGLFRERGTHAPVRVFPMR